MSSKRSEEKEQAVVVKKVAETIEKHKLIENGDHIVIGLSGGPDSLCLFDILCKLRETMGITLEAVHINHMFRPGAADQDQSFVETTCKERNIDCNTFVYDCNAIAAELGMSSEEAGRKVRYEAFDKVAERAVAKGYDKTSVKIAVAQNANDQAETVLFRLIRGTGGDGLAGIEYMRKSEKGFDIIRPVLDITRKEIENYCAAEGLNPCIDKTNAEAVYTRNKIRLELIPYIEENLNPDVLNSLLRLAKTAQEDKEYLWEQSKAEYEKSKIAAEDEEDENENRITLNLENLQKMKLAVRHRVISMAFGEIGLVKDIQRNHIEAADDIIEKGNTGSSIDFPQGYRLSCSYGKVIFSRTEAKDELASEKAEKSNCCHISQIDDEAENSTNNKFPTNKFSTHDKFSIHIENSQSHILKVNLSREKLCKQYGDVKSLKPEIRTRMNGDYIALSEESGTKKLQDLFVDKKISKEKRDQILLLCIGREVLAVLGDEFTGLKTGFTKTRFTGRYRI